MYSKNNSYFRKLKAQLVKILAERSYMYTPDKLIILACGDKSAHYVNVKDTVMTPDGGDLCGILICDAAKDTGAVATGGLELGAVPLAQAVTNVSKNPSVLGFFNAFAVKKELKDHGIRNWLVGPVKAGDKVIILDDVCTTGGSTITAIQRAEECGLIVVGVIIVVDREQYGGMDNIRKYNDNVVALVTLSEIKEAYDKLIEEGENSPE